MQNKILLLLLLHYNYCLIHVFIDLMLQLVIMKLIVMHFYCITLYTAW